MADPSVKASEIVIMSPILRVTTSTRELHREYVTGSVLLGILSGGLSDLPSLIGIPPLSIEKPFYTMDIPDIPTLPYTGQLESDHIKLTHYRISFSGVEKEIPIKNIHAEFARLDGDFERILAHREIGRGKLNELRESPLRNGSRSFWLSHPKGGRDQSTLVTIHRPTVKVTSIEGREGSKVLLPWEVMAVCELGIDAAIGPMIEDIIICTEKEILRMRKKKQQSFGMRIPESQLLPQIPLLTAPEISSYGHRYQKNIALNGIEYESEIS